MIIKKQGSWIPSPIIEQPPETMLDVVQVKPLVGTTQWGCENMMGME